MQPLVLRSAAPSEEPIHMVVAPHDLVLDLIRIFNPKPVPQLLFDRLARPRQCWGEDGELEFLQLSSPESTTRVFQDRGQLDRAIEILCTTNTIKAVPGPMKKRAYEVSDFSTDRHSFSISWELALQLLSHAFPGHYDEIGWVHATQHIVCGFT